MKSIQKIKKVQLKSSHEEKFFLLGIVSSEPDYKLSLSINKKFRTSLKNITAVMITDKIQEHTFSRFSDNGGSAQVVITLVSNRSGKNFLIKKLKNIDYLLHVYDPENEYSVDRIIAMLREIESVNAVFNIDTNIFKDIKLQYLTQ